MTKEEHAKVLKVLLDAGAGSADRRAEAITIMRKEPQGWISVNDRMPEFKPVLGYAKNKILRVSWVPKFSEEIGASDFQGDEDFDEATDTSYWPEGWYEWNEHEEVHWFVSDEVTHWMPLPPPPGKEPEPISDARNFPHNTCPASRHAEIIGKALVNGKPYPMLTEEPEHCGESILSVVQSLYAARTKLALLEKAE